MVCVSHLGSCWTVQWNCNFWNTLGIRSKTKDMYIVSIWLFTRPRNIAGYLTSESHDDSV